MYLICDAKPHILIYYGGIKIIFRMSISLFVYHKDEKHKNILIQLKR